MGAGRRSAAQRTGLALHEGQVDELRAIHWRVQAVTQICVTLGRPEPFWPTRPFHWSALVRNAPTVADPYQILDILDEAPRLAAPGLPEFVHYDLAKAKVVHCRPRPTKNT